MEVPSPCSGWHLSIYAAPLIFKKRLKGQESRSAGVNKVTVNC